MEILASDQYTTDATRHVMIIISITHSVNIVQYVRNNLLAVFWGQIIHSLAPEGNHLRPCCTMHTVRKIMFDIHTITRRSCVVQLVRCSLANQSPLASSPATQTEQYEIAPSHRCGALRTGRSERRVHARRLVRVSEGINIIETRARCVVHATTTLTNTQTTHSAVL